MGRRKEENGHAVRFILNHSKAIVTNVYLILYPKPELARKLHRQPALLGEVWLALRSIAPTSILEQGRVYGGGLHKMEPSELANVPAPELASLLRPFIEPPKRQLALFEARAS
jgi:hypothetical protein